ncbi:ABC transporter substrate-binding protein [Variovorax sp. J22P240]|uniref:ABC transporter substrate-binding protein n=1 Tax=Variovorax sp. J22P240 TaxID=3053514 RepID=UPI0025768F80|nr:ABC transporter substrate-binding protein [Variovorax sp. J22P240]MDM0000757.1 ABC transporter substrate-binding protein [Variovorax sp. J22P240]
MKTRLLGWGAGMVLALSCLLGPAPTSSQQQSKVARIGILVLSTQEEGGASRAIAKKLQEIGNAQGRTAIFELRYANWQHERLAAQAAELVRLKVDVIVAITNIPGFAARKATDRIPIVVWGIHGGVETGLVRSLARPGGNVTGIESLAPELDAKRLELIKLIVPNLTRLGVIYNPDDPGGRVHLLSMRDSARTLGVGIETIEVRRPEDFDNVLTSTAAASMDGLLTFSDDVTSSFWPKVGDFALKNRVPTLCEFRFMVQIGCLVSYGPSLDEFTARVVHQVDQVLKGAKPADIPVEQATRFEMLVNKNTAKALGITIPRAVLLKADEVFE